MNRATLIGNVVEIKATDTRDGGVVVNMKFATNERWKDRNTGERQERTEWHRIAFFGSVAQIVNQYVKKGQKLLIEGQLRTEKWKDKNGQDVYTTKIIVSSPKDQMMMLDRPGDNAGNEQPKQQPQVRQPAQKLKPEFDDQLDDIPF